MIHPLAGIACGIVWFVGCPIVKLLLGKTGAGKRFLDAHPTLTAFGSSGGGGWGGGSGGGFSGGFSGGGGSFGGGGASSSW